MSDFEIVARYRAERDAVPCPHCGEFVSPDWWNRHFERYHPDIELPLCPIMTETEARGCIAAIHEHLKMARALIHDLYTRKGWQVLNYESWRECVVAEFGKSQSHMYRQLAAAITEQHIEPDSPIGEIAESHLRPLTILSPDQAKVVWNVVKKTAPSGKITGGYVNSLVNVLRDIVITRTIDGTEKQISVQDATAADLERAILDDLEERQKRQRLHIERKTKRRLVAKYEGRVFKTTDTDQVISLYITPGWELDLHTPFLLLVYENTDEETDA